MHKSACAWFLIGLFGASSAAGADGGLPIGRALGERYANAEILNRKEGDFNKDGRPDLALIIGTRDEPQLAVLYGSAGGGYALGAMSKQFCYARYGVEMLYENGLLTIIRVQSMGPSTYTYDFAQRGPQMVLVGLSEEEYSNAQSDGSGKFIDYSKGEVTYWRMKDDKRVDVKRPLAKSGPIPLEGFDCSMEDPAPGLVGEDFRFRASHEEARTESVCAPDVFAAIHRSLDIKLLPWGREGGNVVAAACRSSLPSGGPMLAAIAYDEGVKDEKSLLVAVVDGKTGLVTSSLRRPLVEEPGTPVRRESLRLDTARYMLADGVRAFGVRYDNPADAPLCAAPHGWEELTLFVPERSSLRPVLRLNMRGHGWLEGCTAANAWSHYEAVELTLAMASTRTNGFRDVVATAKIALNGSNQSWDSRVERHTLRYDGTAYRKGRGAPWWLGPGP